MATSPYACWVVQSDATRAQLRNYMQRLEPELPLVFCNRDEFSAHTQQLTVLIDGNATADALDAPELSHVIIPWAGVSHALAQRVLARPHLTLHNSHYNAPFVAQHAIALLLAAGHHIPRVHQHLQQDDWHYPREQGLYNLHLAGATVLLLGYGHIGKATEHMLSGFGCHIIRVRRQADSESYGMAQLPEALVKADVIINSLPLTETTENLLDADAFAAMRQGVVLVNVGRGKTIDQHALYQALQSGKVAAAGLDVWWNYPKDESPLLAEVPLAQLDNVVMSPHRADESQGEIEARAQDILHTLQSILAGGNRNQVDPQRGY